MAFTTQHNNNILSIGRRTDVVSSKAASGRRRIACLDAFVALLLQQFVGVLPGFWSNRNLIVVANLNFGLVRLARDELFSKLILQNLAGENGHILGSGVEFLSAEPMWITEDSILHAVLASQVVHVFDKCVHVHLYVRIVITQIETLESFKHILLTHSIEKKHGSKVLSNDVATIVSAGEHQSLKQVVEVEPFTQFELSESPSHVDGRQSDSEVCGVQVQTEMSCYFYGREECHHLGEASHLSPATIIIL